MKWYLLATLLLVSCSGQQGTPESALNYYVKSRFENKSLEETKDFLTEDFYDLLTGEENPDTERIWQLDNLKLKNYKILTTSCGAEDCRITYYLSYYTQADGHNEFLTETKKIAKLVKDDEKWKISDVSHIKTFHDSLNKIDIESD